MEREAIESAKAALEARFGPWTAHNYQLVDDLYTIGPDAGWNHASRVDRVVQLVSRLAAKPVAELRVLDLGALEGLFSVELARRGATVVAVEGREGNAAKIRLAKEALGLDRLEVRVDDIRRVSEQRDGQFDVVLALGVVCLFDAPEVFQVIEALHAMSRHLLIVEANVASRGTATRDYRGNRYHGVMTPGESTEAAPLSEERRWGAMGNARCFRLTPASLCNALSDAGFPVVLECQGPALLDPNPATRTYAALSGTHEDVVGVPTFADAAPRRIPERPVSWLAATGGRARPVAKALLPPVARPLVRKVRAQLLNRR